MNVHLFWLVIKLFIFIWLCQYVLFVIHDLATLEWFKVRPSPSSQLGDRFDFYFYWPTAIRSWFVVRRPFMAISTFSYFRRPCWCSLVGLLLNFSFSKTDCRDMTVKSVRLGNNTTHQVSFVCNIMHIWHMSLLWPIPYPIQWVVMSLVSQVEGSSCGATLPELKLAAFFPSGPWWQMWLEHHANYYMPPATTYMSAFWEVRQLLAKGRRFPPGLPVSSGDKYDLRC